jgi:NTP pyrophosphatase (non-canonical NTP hydrolase)
MTNWQRQVTDFARRYDLRYDPATHTLDLVSEVGEVAKEVLLSTDYGRRTLQFRPQLVDELGDALYSLLMLAEACGVDAGGALGATLEKYERRLTERGIAGAE